MTRNLRIALTVLSIGFALEGIEELYSFLTSGTPVPGASLLFILPLILAVLGLVFVWVGRDEWNDVHRVRARTAGHVFTLSILGGFVAAGVVALLIAVPSIGTPPWAQGLFGAAFGSLVFGTFVVYAYLVFHLVTTWARVAVVLALVWAFVVSVAVSAVLASNLTTILVLINNRTVEIPAFVAPVDLLISYLFVSYFLLLTAYIEAHVAVARGMVTVSSQPGVPVIRNPASKKPENGPSEPDATDPSPPVLE